MRPKPVIVSGGSTGSLRQVVTSEDAGRLGEQAGIQRKQAMSYKEAVITVSEMVGSHGADGTHQK